MSIELLYRIQKVFKPGVSICFFFENDESQWFKKRREVDYQLHGHYEMIDCLSPQASQAYYNYKKQAGFIIYKDIP